MKNIVKIIAAAFLVGTVASCEEDLIVYDAGDGFVQVNTTGGQVAEASADAVVTTVLLGSGTNETGVTVNFSVSSSDASRFTITPANGTLEIPAGEFSADIVFNTVDDLLVNGNLDVTISLDSASAGAGIGLGGEGNESGSRTITIVDDDCPVDLANFTGTFSVFENFTDGVNSPLGLADFFAEAYQLEIAPDPSDATGTKVIINNSAGFNVYINDGTVMTFQACPGTVQFDAGFPVVALFATYEYTDSSYSEADGVIQCTGPLATFGPYQFTFTRL